MIFRLLLLSFVLFASLYAVDTYNTSEQSVFGNQKLPNTLPNDFTQQEIDNILRTKNVHMQYTHYPKTVYDKQKFTISLKAIISLDNLSKIDTAFKDSFGVKVLNPMSPWKPSEEDEHIYTNQFELIITHDEFQLPVIKIDLYQNENYRESARLQPKEVKFKKIIVATKNFSNILAKDLKILGQKTKQYDNNNLLTVMEIQASESNLKEFYLEGYEKQGLESFESNPINQTIFYYVITPIFVKQIQFNYYNTQLKKTINVKVPIVLKEDLVSTQTDLNPNTSGFLFFKKVALAVSIFLLLVLFYFKRSIIIIILIMILGIVLSNLMMPNPKTTIPSDTHVYILPTKNSTIFHITSEEHTVEILDRKVDFSKVLFENEAIGWIKNDALQKGK